MKMFIAQKTDVGCRRQENQDDMGWFSLPVGELILVADGMGGEAGGREAAGMAISTIKAFFEKEQGTVFDLLDLSLCEANQRIYEKGHSGDPRTHNMGTTVVALVVKDDEAFLAHVGDSRIYLYRNGKLNRMTRDHSRVQKMVEAGLLTPEEAEDHPESNIITRALGASPQVEPEVRSAPVPIEANDLFLLCTDGLSSLVRDREIEEILYLGGSVEALCGNLVAAALNRGGSDNVTVQLVRFEEEEAGLLPLGEPEEEAVSISPSKPRKGWPILLGIVIPAALLCAAFLLLL